MMYKLRAYADTGDWLSFLLPLCLFHLTVKSNSELDKLKLAIMIWLPVSHFIRSMQLKNKLPLKIVYALHAILPIPVSVFLSRIISFDTTKVYLIFFIAAIGYNCLISKLLLNCPGSFSLVEVQIVAQGIVFFVLNSLISLKEVNEQSSVTKYDEAINLLKLLLLGLLFLVFSLYAVPSLRKGIKFHFICFSFAILMILVWCFYYQTNFILWFWSFLTYSQKRIYLLFFWLVSTVTSIAFVIWINQRPGYSASALDRKYFHFIISGIYLPGIIYDIQFLCFASGIALGAFIVLEIYRILEVPIVGPLIDQAFQVFLDEKDSGPLILTHIYLLIGCSSPIWLSSFYVDKNAFHISLLSGIISVGFGDTFAAIGGNLYGKHCWKGSKKTVEGTLSAIIFQLLCLFFLLFKGHQLSIYNISLATISAVFTSLLEAKTTHIDNLVLPLFMFSFLLWID